MSRRRSPRPAAAGVRAVLDTSAPRTPLAAAQSAWGEVAGEAIAAASQPVAERAGVVTIRCQTATWAEELALIEQKLLAALQVRLGDGAPRKLRFELAERP